MIKRLAESTAAQKIYMVWITSLMLGAYAYQRPLERLLGKIRAAGIISISPASLRADMGTAVRAVVPTLILWAVIFAVWLLLSFVGMTRAHALPELLFGKIQVTDALLAALFYIGMWIEMIWAAFYYATFQIPFASALVFIAMQCFAVRIVLTEHTKREWIWIGCLTALGIACELYTTRGAVLRLVLLLLASDGISVRKVMRHYLAVNAIACGLIILLAGLGIAGSWIEYGAYRDTYEMQNRYVWGFNSPNTTHYVLIRLALVAMYLWWDKLRWWHIAGVLACNYALYRLTDSRTGYLVGLAACLLAVFFMYCRKLRDWKVWAYLAVLMIGAMAVFSLHFLRWDFYQYDKIHTCPGYVYQVNSMMVGRIHQALKYTQGVEISPFGTRQPNVRCDMGYIKLFFQEGFLFYGIYLAALFRMLFWQRRNRDYAGYIIIVSVSIRMLMESSFVPFVFQNIIWLLFIGRWPALLGPMRTGKKGWNGS